MEVGVECALGLQELPQKLCLTSSTTSVTRGRSVGCRTFELPQKCRTCTAVTHPYIVILIVMLSLQCQVSMFNDEIFIVGKPPILLHSKDSGKSWERVPLSPKVRGRK